jgi:hypothetical protein
MAMATCVLGNGGFGPLSRCLLSQLNTRVDLVYVLTSSSIVLW